MSDKHEIRTVADFCAIPADKIAACLADFADYMDAVRNSNLLTEALSEFLGIPSEAVSMRDDCFLWVDDGVSGVSTVQFSDHKGEIIGRIDLSEHGEAMK